MLHMQRGSLDDILSRGMGRFVWQYGVVCFGSLYFLTNTLVRWLSNNPAQRYDFAMVGSLLIVSFTYSLMVGAAFGFVAWFTLLITARLFRQGTQRASQPAQELPAGRVAAETHSVAATGR
jgi:hypothetical protein